MVDALQPGLAVGATKMSPEPSLAIERQRAEAERGRLASRLSWCGQSRRVGSDEDDDRAGAAMPASNCVAPVQSAEAGAGRGGEGTVVAERAAP